MARLGPPALPLEWGHRNSWWTPRELDTNDMERLRRQGEISKMITGDTQSFAIETSLRRTSNGLLLCEARLFIGGVAIPVDMSDYEIAYTVALDINRLGQTAASCLQSIERPRFNRHDLASVLLPRFGWEQVAIEDESFREEHAAIVPQECSLFQGNHPPLEAAVVLLRRHGETMFLFGGELESPRNEDEDARVVLCGAASISLLMFKSVVRDALDEIQREENKGCP
jgi:hypothetical protein